MQDTAVILLNWNGLAHLQEFLPPMIENTPEATIYLADNCSTDNSISWVQKHHPEVQIVKNDKNYGFAEGYNKALEKVDAKYFALVNTDIQVTKGWLKPMVQLLNKNKEIAACQPKVKAFLERTHFEHAGAAGGYIDYLGYPFCRGRLFDIVEEDKGQYDYTQEVFWATGACVLIRAELFKEAGGFDPIFFAHMEEIDLCWRLKNQGHKIYCCAESEVLHVGGGTLDYQNPRKTFLNFRNNLLMLYKNLPAGRFLRILLARMCLDGVAGIKFLFAGEFAHFTAVLKAHFNFYGLIGTYRKKRKALKQLRTTPNPTGIYQRSLVMEFFTRGKKTFDLLDPREFS